MAAASRSGYLRRMTTPQNPIYAGYRYPAELISYAVWLYFRFPLSRLMVEEMLAARGISVTYETLRQWGLKFGRELANGSVREPPAAMTNGTSMRSSSPSPGRSIGCGARLTKRASFSMSLVQSRRDKKAAKRLFRKLLKKQGRAPRVHLAAIRMLFDWLVVGQVLAVNPAHAVRGPKHVVRRGKTPVLTEEQARRCWKVSTPRLSLVSATAR